MAPLIFAALLTMTGLLLTPSGARAEDTPPGPIGTPEPIHIFATDWGLTLKSDGTGFYNDLARLILTPDGNAADYAVDYEILPYRRAKRHFFEEAGTCLYPSTTEYLATTGDIQNRVNFIDSPSTLTNRIHIFAAHGHTPPKSRDDLNGKRIAYAMGSRLPYALEGPTALFIAVAYEVDKAEMLLSGRVDLITAAMPDAKFVFEKLGVETAPYDPDLVITKAGVGVVCHNTPENVAFISDLTNRLAELKASGALAAFLRAQGLEPEDYIDGR